MDVGGGQYQTFIMTNAVDTKKFVFSSEKRKRLRRELALEGAYVVGNIARISYQKNHSFLLSVLQEIIKKDDSAVLMLVGRGELEDELRREVALKGLSKNVIFMGIRNDVPDLLNAMDLFILPSYYEGLPVSLVEAQMNGVPVIVSDTVTKEVQISDNITYLSLGISASEWACKALAMRRYQDKYPVTSFKYDIDNAVERLKEYYYRYA